MDLTKFWFQYSRGINKKSQIFNNRVCVLLTGLPVAFSQDKNCMLAQAGIRNAEKKNFQTSFINIYQNLPLNFLGIILTTFQFNNAFLIEISDAVSVCACLILTRFFMFSNGRNTL